jgi:tetratricopeptide (TPR) repeat protein
VIRALFCVTAAIAAWQPLVPVGLQSPGAPSRPAAHETAAVLSRRAYQASYNLDYEPAIALARQAVAAAPDDSDAHRTLATTLWLQIIFVRGDVTIDPYLNGVLHEQALLSPLPSGLDAECRQETARAIDLAVAWAAREPQALDARYELGAAYALRASYIASVTGNTSSAFGAARHAYEAEASVFEHDPSRSGAAVIVGLYRYIISTLALPSRLFAYVAGFSGDKAKGISILESAAAQGDDSHVEASVALLLIYAREGRHGDAVRVATRLETEFPRNRLFTLEAGSAAVRAGRGAEADAILSRGLAALATDTRPRFPNERALWLLKRGMARTEMDRLADARMDLGAGEAEAPSGWIGGRIHLALGRVDDLSGRRSDAVAEYGQSRRLCEAAHDSACVDSANHLLDKPFHDKGAAP